MRFCRPVRLDYIKKSEETVFTEIEAETAELGPLLIELPNEKLVLVDFDFVIIMIYGNVLACITNTKSMQNCSICEAKPKEISDIRNLNNFKPCKDTLIYDMSSLHAWIRYFECLPYVSYRLEIKTWRVTKKLKAKYIERKKLIKKKCMTHLVDMPRSEGAETNTTGNVCRKHFQIQHC